MIRIPIITKSFVSIEIRTQEPTQNNDNINEMEQLTDKIRYSTKTSEDMQKIVNSIKYEQYIFNTYSSVKIENIYGVILKDNVGDCYDLHYWDYNRNKLELFFIEKSIRISGVLVSVDPEKDLNDYNNVPPLDIPQCILHLIYRYMKGVTILNKYKRNHNELPQMEEPCPKKRKITNNGMSYIMHQIY